MNDIKTWTDRMYSGLKTLSPSAAMQAEIRELRAALAARATPADNMQEILDELVGVLDMEIIQGGGDRERVTEVTSKAMRALNKAHRATPAQPVSDLHNAIMNLPCHGFDYAYKEGHRDARHAAAELAAAHEAERTTPAQPVAPVIREAIEATFEQRDGYLTKIAAAVRALDDCPSPASVSAAILNMAMPQMTVSTRPGFPCYTYDQVRDLLNAAASLVENHKE